jgi:hypothetical protein
MLGVHKELKATRITARLSSAVGQGDISMATLETLMHIAFWAILILIAAFFISIPVNKTKHVSSLLLPAYALALYVPYELYFRIPEVSLGVPIRVDLLLLLPVFGLAFPTNALMWFMVCRRRKTEGSAIGRLPPIMAAVMTAATVCWPLYFFLGD